MKNERDLPPAIDAATRFSIRPAPVSALSTFLKRDSLLSSFPPFFRDSSGTKGRGEEKKGRGYFPRTFSFGPVNLDHPPFNPLPVPKLVLRLRSRIKDFLYKRARARIVPHRGTLKVELSLSRLQVPTRLRSCFCSRSCSRCVYRGAIARAYVSYKRASRLRQGCAQSFQPT